MTRRGKNLKFCVVTFPLAFAIGISVASIPGPVILLIVTETLRRGPRAGLLTMIAPVLIDALVMLPLGLFLRASLFSGTGALVLGFVGAGFLGWLGLQSMQAANTSMPVDGGLKTSARGAKEMPSFLKGVLTHLTSPFPYLYWGTVGSSFIWQEFESAGSWISAAVFPLGFWLGTSTFSSLVIHVVGRGKTFLPQRIEPFLHRLSGILLMSGGVLLIARIVRGSF